jgi:subfamily B ATP-binding cassette protein MsbA
VVFETVGFAYEPGKPVLRDISLRLEAGRTLAVVGPSGAGKTTIVNLLLGFHEPTEGRILIDGQDLRTVAVESLRDHIGVVFQDTFLFRASVLENIRFGNLGASDEQVVQAARAAHAHEFILELPQSYNTEVGERGATLSGGQRQRIAIARALLRDLRILILDEATSALDAESEQVVGRAVAELTRGRTCLSISHRLASVAGCDSIIVLENGRMAAAGTHEELLAGSALYRRLYELQTTRNSAPNFA